ncbi:MAG TPA: peptidase C56 [Rhodospirillaceae bacterium]|nr:MAG: hypothetical protein A2018_03675 [Alphaproteobacteria bacterium GWF2_58_20]HAU29665.1 peptidase C56 [Rhodospirillaceae bacterium]
MQDTPLKGKKVAILAANGVQENHLTDSQKKLLSAGATIVMVGVESGVITSWQGKGWGHHFAIDTPISTFLASDHDMLLIPGGERSTDTFLKTPHTARIIDSVMAWGLPMAILGEGAQMLATSTRAKGCVVAAPDSIREKIVEAGLECSEDAIHEDRNVLSFDGVGNLDEFLDRMITFFANPPASLAVAE